MSCSFAHTYPPQTSRLVDFTVICKRYFSQAHHVRTLNENIPHVRLNRFFGAFILITHPCVSFLFFKSRVLSSICYILQPRLLFSSHNHLLMLKHCTCRLKIAQCQLMALYKSVGVGLRGESDADIVMIPGGRRG